jgi:hypothetical protein
MRGVYPGIYRWRGERGFRRVVSEKGRYGDTQEKGVPEDTSAAGE